MERASGRAPRATSPPRRPCRGRSHARARPASSPRRASACARAPRYPHRMSEEMTRAQYDKLAADLAELEGPKRAEIVEAIAVARGYGDLSENFEYHSAKNEQGLLERRITILRARLENASVVDGTGS